MKLSTRTRYGIRAAIELAQNYGSDPINLKLIARSQNISIKYLEQLMTIMIGAGIVRSVRGSKGGYILKKPPEEITFAELFNALEGPLVLTECVDDAEYCTKGADCAAKDVWTRMSEIISDFFDSITLKDMVKKSRKENFPSYQI